MKRILTYILSGGILFSVKSSLFAQTKIAQIEKDSTIPSIYGRVLKTLDGKGYIDFAAFKGRKILIVNTASECGLTKQYEALQLLQEKYKETLVIIGCPCNQFGGQEPGDSTEIREFCSSTYGVTFQLSEKLDVHGKNQHSVYKWLTQKTENGVMDATITWNFNKFLLDESGHLMAYFPGKVKPDDPQLVELINK